MQHFLKDLKHALRMFRENPGFTATAVAALMLGIGANTAIFSVVNAVLLKPVPFPNPASLVELMNSQNGAPTGPAASPAKFMHWRAQTDVLEDVAAFRGNSLNYTGGDIPERVSANQVSEAYFRVFGAPVIRGRGFSEEEDLPNGPKVAVISYDFWQRRLDGDPDVIGKRLPLSGDTYTVVGVVGPEFDMRQFGDPDLWVPFQLDPGTTDQGHFFRAAGRLKPGVSLQQAQTRLEASAAQYRERFPNALGKDAGFSALSFQEALVGPLARKGLWVMLGAVAFVLLIACANVANLLLVRATGRGREIAIRSAMGAGRGRIIRQLLTESVLLSLTGGVLGLVVGFLGMRALLAVNTAGLPRLGEGGTLMGLDWRVVGFTLALSFATGILFGLVPALVSSRTDLNSVIKDSASRSGSGFRQNKTRSILVTLEVGLAVVLLIGAALLIRTTIALGRVDPGFDPHNVVTMRTSLSGPRFTKSNDVEQMARIALERVRAMPGVAAATATCCVPLQGGYGLPFNIIGRENPGPGPYTGGGGFVATSPGYFETFGIPVLRGRPFDDRDDVNAPPVVVISESLAKQFWKDGADPLQDRMLIGGGAANMSQLAEEPVRQIIGVVGDVRARGLGNDPGPIMYIPQAQMPDALNALNLRITPMAWVVRTQVEPTTISARIQDELRQATGLPVTDVRSMEDVVRISTSQQRLSMLLMSIFGGMALLLAAIGIYGLMAYSVQQRTQEIGIRMALGAEAARVKRMVIRQGMALVGIGLVVGLVAAFYAAKLLGAFLFEVEPRDIPVFVTVPVVLALIALAAVWFPAGRASRVDPLDAVRYE
jgi:putative ABC transport system permease protein